jgi:glycosyltransferase involved in cell wall biosynthesis
MNKKNTICFVNTTKTWGGGEKWHFEMATYLHKKGYNILVIASPNSELSKKLAKEKVPQENIKISNFSYVNFYKVNKVISFYNNHNVSTVVINSSQDMKLGGLAAKKANVKRIIYRRGSAIPIKNTFINRFFFRKVLTEVLANSEATKKTINAKNNNLFPVEKIKVIPNGIDTDLFLSKDYKPLYKKEKNEFIIGNLGRFVQQKNQYFLLEVTKELLKRGIPVKLIIGGNGKLETSLKTSVQHLNIADNVVFTGFVKNPKDLMHSCDIFVLSSLWEGFGYVIAEAFLCEKPVVAFDVSSNPELVKDGKNGFLIPLNQVNIFCDKIAYFYNNKQEISKMGVEGKKQIIKENDVHTVSLKVEKYLTQELI